MRLGKALEDLVRKEAKERQVAGGKKGGRGRPKQDSEAAGIGSGILPEPIERGDTRDRVAAAVGMSPKTYEHAKEVVEAADKDPGLGPIVDEMDRTGKVNPAYKNVRARKQKPAKPKKRGTRIHNATPALNRLVDEGTISEADASFIATLKKEDQKKLISEGVSAVGEG